MRLLSQKKGTKTLLRATAVNAKNLSSDIADMALADPASEVGIKNSILRQINVLTYVRRTSPPPS